MKAHVVDSRFLVPLIVSLGALLGAGCDRKPGPEQPEKTDAEVAAERGREAKPPPPPRTREEHLPTSALHQKAMKAAIWATPIVSMDAMRQAYFRDAHARYNDIVYWSKPADWKNQTTTPNATSNYVYFNFNLKDGPVVVEVPPAVGAGLFGSVLDAWQVPKADVGPEGTDAGKGGKYVLVPPNYQGALPSGHSPVRFDTINGYALLRAIPEDRSPAASERAVALIKKLRVHPLTPTGKPAEPRFVDMSGKLFDGLVHFDESFFTSLARMVDEEPPLSRDATMLSLLRSMGIEKGKAFKAEPADELRKAAQDVHRTYERGLPHAGEQYWGDRRWRTPSALGAKTGFTFESNGVLNADERGMTYFGGYAPPLKLGKASLYLTAFVDGAGNQLAGASTYKLHVPPKVPARQFWSVTVYDVSTAAFMRESPKVELNSLSAVLNADRSVDVHFGPKPPPGKGANWVYTAPGKPWFAMFRFYGPEAPIFDKKFKLEDFEKAN